MQKNIHQRGLVKVAELKTIPRLRLSLNLSLKLSLGFLGFLSVIGLIGLVSLVSLLSFAAGSNVASVCSGHSENWFVVFMIPTAQTSSDSVPEGSQRTDSDADTISEA
jgi:hypothetical protein